MSEYAACILADNVEDGSVAIKKLTFEDSDYLHMHSAALHAQLTQKMISVLMHELPSLLHTIFPQVHLQEITMAYLLGTNAIDTVSTGLDGGSVLDILLINGNQLLNNG